MMPPTEHRAYDRGAVQASPALVSDLGRYFGISSLSFLDTGSWNLAYEANAGMKQLFIKVLRPRSGHHVRSPQALEKIFLQLSLRPAARTITAVLPIAWPDGAFTRMFDDGTVMVFPFISGCEPFGANSAQAPPSRLLARAARSLASFHAATGLPPMPIAAEQDIPHVLGLAAWADQRERLFSDARARAFASLTPGDTVDLEFAAVCAEAVAARLDAESSPCALVHGDYRADNILFDLQRDRLVLVDFDLARIGAVYEEVAYSALNFSGARWLYPPAIWDRFWSFIDLYFAAVRCPVPESILMWTTWVILKWVSLSFKGEQIRLRTQLLREMLSSAAAMAPAKKVLLPDFSRS